MILQRTFAAIAMACICHPALAASLHPMPATPSFSGGARAYVRVSFGQTKRSTTRAGLGLTLFRTQFDPLGFSRNAGRRADLVALEFGRDGAPETMLAGGPLSSTAQKARRSGQSLRSPWNTIALVAGGLALAGGATFTYLVYKAEKSSD